MGTTVSCKVELRSFRRSLGKSTQETADRTRRQSARTPTFLRRRPKSLDANPKMRVVPILGQGPQPWRPRPRRQPKAFRGPLQGIFMEQTALSPPAFLRWRPSPSKSHRSLRPSRLRSPQACSQGRRPDAP
eukprot:scaffold4678_cov242-Pinguiococcus_pyrenoidosus.AAC.10